LKYGKISLITDQYDTINLGDVLQDLACDYLYHTMGISEEQVIEISCNEMCTYDGEYAVVPVYNAVLDGYFEPYHTLSPKIIPVFLGLASDLSILPRNTVDYLKQYEPIGCRDQYTLDLMRGHGIRAYLGGCITTILPKREKAPEDGKIFFTHVPEQALPYVPKEYLERGEFLRQEGCFAEYSGRAKRRAAMKRAARDFYKRYEQEAALVVTSKLHSTLPCLAMGIPVVLVRDEMWKTFTFVDAFLPVWLPDTYEKIDWRPRAVVYDELKVTLLRHFQSRLRAAFEENRELCTIGDFYEMRKKTVSGLDFEMRLEKMVRVLQKNVGPDFSYIIWGAGIRGHMARGRIEKYFPQAKLLAYADKVKRGEFDGLPVIGIERLQEYPAAYIVICNNTGEAEAQRKMAELGRQEYRDYCSTNLKNEGEEK